MARNYARDESGIIEKCVRFLLKKYPKDFSFLSELCFLYVWRLGKPEYEEGRMLPAKIKSVSVRERDLYSVDVELRIHRDTWESMTKVQKTQLIFGLLLRVRVSLDEDFKLIKDDDGRVCFEVVSPDVLIKIFRREVDEWGIPSEYEHLLKDLGIKTPPKGVRNGAGK